MESKVRGWAAEQDDDELADEEEEVGHPVEDDHPQQVPHHQLEGRAGGGAEAEALRESYQIFQKTIEPHARVSKEKCINLSIVRPKEEHSSWWVGK